jgi:hypothetical protein
MQFLRVMQKSVRKQVKYFHFRTGNPSLSRKLIGVSYKTFQAGLSVYLSCRIRLKTIFIRIRATAFKSPPTPRPEQIMSNVHLFFWKSYWRIKEPFGGVKIQYDCRLIKKLSDPIL